MFHFGDNGEKQSLVARAVFGLSEGHSLIEATDYDRRLAAEMGEAEEATQCVLRSSSEEHWVSHFASICLDRSRPHRPGIAFNSFCEIPSKRSEKMKAAGYDLSLGPYDSMVRLRTMHKATRLAWCDRPWTIHFTKDDIAHLQSLAAGQHPFFLVVHAFYCIHDWRRMGHLAVPDDDNQLDTAITVPDMESIARTIIFELDAVRATFTDQEVKAVRIRRLAARPEGNSSAERLASLIRPDLYRIELNNEVLTDNDEALRPISLNEFLQVIDDYWRENWEDSEIGKK